jgi:hypothetical protein
MQIIFRFKILKSIIKDKIEIYKTNLKTFWQLKAVMKVLLVEVD